MSQAPPGSRVPAPDLPLLGALYLVEISALFLVVVAGKSTARSLLGSLLEPWGVVLVAASLAFLVGAAVVVRRYRTRGHRVPRQFGLTVLLNLIPLLAFLAVGEVAVRALSHPSPRGPMFRNMALLPWAWSDVLAHNRALLEQSSLKGSYLVADPQLGWAIRPSRRSADGLYFSSVEGLRSPEPGVALGESHPRHRVAIIGDSFTFGLEVGYADTWGRRLEQALGPDVQVLNFGVDGYGVDQAVLRYQRDVRSWRPDVVILGLITHDLYRSMATYAFVSFPGWPFPFGKPRFVTEGDRLRLLNVPSISPEGILAARSISELPFVQYDAGYVAEEWRRSPLDVSYLYRFLVSKYRRWAEDYEESALDARAAGLNREIVRMFIREVTAAGSVPLVVYFPSRVDFRRLHRVPGWQSVGQKMLRGGDIPHLDLTTCLGALDPDARFGPQHYSARGNGAVADCLRGPVAALLSGERSPRSPGR